MRTKVAQHPLAMAASVIRAARLTTRCCEGFTLLEALVAMALMGIIIGAIATVTAQWLPNWNRGIVRVQRNEQVAIALDRLVGDVSNAMYVTPNRNAKELLFVGAELGVAFVRGALGPNSRPGLEIVRIAETADRDGLALVRMRAPFAPLSAFDPSLSKVLFADPVVLLRAPLRVTFSYAGPDGVWKPAWQGSELPAAVRFIVRDATAERVLAVSSATQIHVNMMPPQPEQAADANDPTNAAPARGRREY
ncbi:MAG TPA: type II secretion system protein [Xanthobacteraceae bacterium]|nr:type II secretion system protein [Xanthobacteraceae bacterium]